jgi:hypothetical protein
LQEKDKEDEIEKERLFLLSDDERQSISDLENEAKQHESDKLSHFAKLGKAFSVSRVSGGGGRGGRGGRGSPRK